MSAGSVPPEDVRDHLALALVPGLGPRRTAACLGHFGSAKAVSRAGIEDLKAVGGISADMAKKIYGFFHERSP